jgi:hypothetical protein
MDGSAARLSARLAGASDQAITNVPPASAVKNSPSAAIVKPTPSRMPRIAPWRSQRPCSRSRSSHHSTTGASQPDDQLRCPFACDTKPGANPQNSPPIAAARRLRVTQRSRNRYQATAEPARLRVSTVTNVTCGPASMVSGASRNAYAVTDVFAARFTPSGMFSIVAKNGSPPCRSSCVPYASTHSKNAWSPTLSAIARSYGCCHRPLVRYTAIVSATSATIRCGRRARTSAPTAGGAGRSSAGSVSGTATVISRRLASSGGISL